MNLEYSRSQLHNWILPSFWTIAFLLSAVRMQTLVGMVRNDVSLYNFLFSYSIY